MPLDILDRMRSFPLFMTASEEFLVAIGKHLRPQIHSAHDVILTEGDEAKAMFWLVRGVVAVTSRDGEAVYAELKPGSFFGEIGVLMDKPRTATIVARTKCLLLALKREDLHQEMPRFPEMETAIRQEAHERLTILNKKRRESGRGLKNLNGAVAAREAAPGEVLTGEVGAIAEGAVVNHKKRKSPSPSSVIEDPTAGSALGSGLVSVRQTLKELPLFSTLPPDILHFLGMSVQPKTYAPFTDIIRQGTVGNEIYFIVRGEAEVIHDTAKQDQDRRITRSSSMIRPRLKQGQYFGEVASLGLSHRRTATVRSITTVECIMVGGEALDELWKKCPPDIKTQVEETARDRMTTEGRPEIPDVEMTDVDSSSATTANSAPQVTFTTPSKPSSPIKDELDQMKPKDPDPYLSVDMENMRTRRRGSLAPPTPTGETLSSLSTNGTRLRKLDTANPLKFSAPDTMSPDVEAPPKRARTLPRRPYPGQQSVLPDDMLVAIFQYFNIVELLRLREVSSHWRKLLATSPKLCTEVDLTPYNRKVTDSVLINVLAPFIGPRLEAIDLSNCFHITDEGFSTLWKVCGKNVKIWKMKSVWDVSANQILEMSDNAKNLEEVNWSNCRKVGDNLLARVVGWVVPEHANPTGTKQVVITSSAARLRGQKPQMQTVMLPPPGTVIGCPKLKRLDLSYCKHITDRSMAHLAAHASNRLESLCLTRCTSISDAGFQSWTPFRFHHLSRLCLADCTYLSDNAVVSLVNAAKALTHLDLSFCCALSDTATEVVALGLPNLQELKMAFCGSAVSDNSLASIALHLHDLRRLSVRGCVRVTAAGVETVLDGCAALSWADVSQCRNLEPWVKGGGVERWGYDERAQQRGNNGESRGAGSTGAAGTDHKGFMRQPTLAMTMMTTTLIQPPRGLRNRRARPPVAFVVEKGAGGLR